MDVRMTPKLDVPLPSAKSDTVEKATPGKMRPSEYAFSGTDLSKIPGRSVEALDPVKRAEETIGPLFEDERFPNGRLSIEVDNDSGRYVYRLINQETKEVLKQFPGDYVLRRVAYYRELQGISVDDTA